MNLNLRSLRFIPLVFFASCYCSSYDHGTYAAFNDNLYIFFHQVDIRYINQNDQVATLHVTPKVCTSDKESKDSHECTVNKIVECGQHTFSDPPFTQLTYYFGSGLYVYEFHLGPEHLEARIPHDQDTVSIVTGGKSYGHITRVEALDTAGNIIEEMYLSNLIGPVKYVFANGDVWMRLP